MKKIILLIAIAQTAAISYLLVQSPSKIKSKTLTTTVWHYIGDCENDMTDPDFYIQTGSETGCGSYGNVPCTIEVPNGITPGGAQDDLEAYLEQFQTEPYRLIDEARSRKECI